MLGGARPQEGMLGAVVRTDVLWRKQSLSVKLLSLLGGRWQPDESSVFQEAHQVFLDSVFGDDDDFGPALLELMEKHGRRDWDFGALREDDRKRARALSAWENIAQQRLSNIASSPPLNLQLGKYAPALCELVYPLIMKVPIISLRYYVHAHAAYTFNEVRRSEHESSDDIIALMYELLLLQQKIAIGLLEYLRKASRTRQEKKDALLIEFEMDAIMNADLLFTYLKASVEKTIALVAAAYSIPGMDGKKSHKAKMNALLRHLPADAQGTYYGGFFLEVLSSENLDDLNSYRSGILHKKGIADLQPHNYVGKPSADLPFMKVYSILHRQHLRNTGALLVAFALLTDVLMKREMVGWSEAQLAEKLAWAYETFGCGGARGPRWRI